MLMLLLLGATSAFAQPTSEWAIDRGAYTVIGDGIAYEDSGWQETDPTIGSRTGEWFMETGPLTWTLDKSDKMLYLYLLCR